MSDSTTIILNSNVLYDYYFHRNTFLDMWVAIPMTDIHEYNNNLEYASTPDKFLHDSDIRNLIGLCHYTSTEVINVVSVNSHRDGVDL